MIYDIYDDFKLKNPLVSMVHKTCFSGVRVNMAELCVSFLIHSNLELVQMKKNNSYEN